MAFIIENNTVISFAEYSDLAARDQRLFDNNERDRMILLTYVFTLQ